MSDANSTTVRAIKEATFGTTPATPAFATQRVLNSNLTAAVETVASQELATDRNVKDLILVGENSGGGWGYEVSFEAQDLLIEGAMMAAWSLKTVKEGTTEITDVETTGDTYTTTASVPAWALGMIVQASGFADALNNGLKNAIVGSGSTTLDVSENLADDTPALGTEKLKLVGILCAVGDCATTSGASDLITISASTGDFTDYGLAVGQWINLGGTATLNQFATVGLNDWVRISAITATVLTLDVVPAAWATDAGAAKEIQIWIGDSISNGTTKVSFAIEEYFADLTVPEWLYYNGMRVDTLDFSAPAKSILTGSVTFQGSEFAAPVTSRFAAATTVDAPTNDVQNTSSNVGTILEGGTPVGSPNYVLESTWQIANNLRRQSAVANVGDIGIGLGQCVVTGTLNTYYGSSAIYTKLLNNTETSYVVQTKNSNQGMVYDFPRVKFTEGDPQVSGLNTDRTLPMNFQAIQDATLGYSISIQTFTYFEE